MNYGGEAAEQIVRMSLAGMEVAVKITGIGAKNLAVLLAATLREEQKIQGKTRLTNMLKSGKELTIFTIPTADMGVFSAEAKRYGVLYSVVSDRQKTSRTTDIITRAEDAPKINRIIERFHLIIPETDIAGDLRRGSGPEQLIEEVLGSNPQRAGREAEHPSGKNSKKEAGGSIRTTTDKLSIKEKLANYRKGKDDEIPLNIGQFFSKKAQRKER